MPEGPLFKAAAKGDLKQVKSLLASGIKPDGERDYYKYTSLLKAVLCGHTDIVIALIEAKANVNARTSTNSTPLIKAAINGNIDIAIALIKAKAHINAQNMYKQTPLMKAALSGCTDIAVKLVKSKANLNAKSNNGDDAIRMATHYKRTDTASVLVQARNDYAGFLKTQKEEEERKNNACRREYGRAFAQASLATKPQNYENIIKSKELKRLPPGYRDLIQFFSRNPGLVKWTGASLLLYFNAASVWLS